MRAPVAGASRAMALLALVLVLGCAALVDASVSGPTGAGRASEAPGQSPHLAATSARRLRISGHVMGLYPGARKRLTVRIDNPARTSVLVRTLRTRVGAPGGACESGHVRVGTERMLLMIGPRSSATARLTARMTPGAPDGCQLARFPLHFDAVAAPAP